MQFLMPGVEVNNEYLSKMKFFALNFESNFNKHIFAQF